MKRRIAIAALLIVLVAGGCRTRKVKVVMHREANGGIRREVTTWIDNAGTNESSTLSEQELAPLRAAYGPGRMDIFNHPSFEATFRDRIPSDLFANGSTNSVVYGRLISPLGRVECYAERLPGPTEPAKMLEAGKKILDISVRAFTAYAESLPVLKTQPEKLKRIHHFLETDFRRDAENIALIWWANLPLRTGQQSDAWELLVQKIMIRALMYLRDAGYLNSDDLSIAPAGNDPQVLKRGIARKLATVLGHKANEPLSPELTAIANDSEFLSRAFKDGLKRIGITEEQFQSMVNEAIIVMPLDETSIDITWPECSRPTLTNGEYDASARRLSWHTAAATPPNQADVLFARWAVPNEPYQVLHFGSIVVEPDKLDVFNGWYATLSPDDRKQWDSFVNGLNGGKYVTDRLREFRFTPKHPASRPAGNTPDNTPVQGAQIILQGLRAGG